MGFRAPLIFCVFLLSAASVAAEPPSARPAPHLEKVTAEVYRLVETLGLSATGRTLIERARKVWGLKEWKELRRKVTLGHVSRTDAVLTRHFNSVTGEESRERNVTITIRAAQPFGERVLDLAHELTHAVADPAWDPYDPDLTPGRYIHYSLESSGGEI